MREAPNFFVFFSLMAKFDKRWSSNMIMLESSDRVGGGDSVRPTTSCATGSIVGFDTPDALKFS